METLDLKTTNLYELFDLSPGSNESEIKKAFRKKALLYHPDKNPDNPRANEFFQKLSKALEILTDVKARASYDKILKAQQERHLRNKKFDAKRKKLKDDLEAREKLQTDIIEEEERLKQEIERIRKEGSKQLEEENQLLKKKLEQRTESINIINNNGKLTTSSSSLMSAMHNTIKVKLKRSRRSSDVEITDDLIQEKFSRFGPILSVVTMKKSALLEYEHFDSLKRIAADCPQGFEFEIINVNKNTNNKNTQSTKQTSPTAHQNQVEVKKPDSEPEISKPTVQGLQSDDDYEDYILRRMEEAEQNKKRKIE